MTSTFDSLVADYLTDPNADHCSILEEISDLDDDRVDSFLLSVLTSPNQSDLLQTTILKAYRIHRFRTPMALDDAGIAVLGLVRSSPDSVVRSYAIMACCKFLALPAVLAELRVIALDPSLEEAHRFNALAALESHKNRPEVAAVLRELRDSSDLGPYVSP